MSGYDRQVYVLDPKVFSPETIAVAFAKTSRSPESFLEIARDLTDAKSAEFNEKWVVGYGHSSVAEHAVLHIAIENVSRLAVETIESSRLASFTEKSTRYQKWSSQAYFVPDEVIKAGLEPKYREVCATLFDAYQRSLPLCRDVLAGQCPRDPNENESAYERRLKSVYVDSCRYLLPAAALANVGMTANARVLEHLISKMLSHPLSEVRQIGEEIKQVSQVEVPTLVKYANHTPYLEFTQQPGMGNRRINPNPEWCSLVDYSEDGELRFLASLLYRDGCGTYADALEYAKSLTRTEQEQLAARYLATMQRFDYPLRESEHIFYTFDVSMDQGAYYEVKRHRMMTQTPQGLTCSQGYVVPKLMADAGFVNDYNQAMQDAADGFSRLADISPAAAAYLVPNGYKRRVLITMNFREAFTFIQLRSSQGAHFGVRLIAQRMAEQIKAVHPVLGSYLRANTQETWQSILDENFHSW